LTLRRQLTVLQRQIDRPRVTPADRAFLAALLHRLPRAKLRRLHLIVSPDTVLRWHRDLMRRSHAKASRRKKRPGRPPTRRSIQALVLRLAPENSGWGYRRIHGEPAALGIKVAPSTVGDPPGARDRARTGLVGASAGERAHRPGRVAVPVLLLSIGGASGRGADRTPPSPSASTAPGSVVTPPRDGQHLFAVVKSRRREPEGWWYDLQIHLPSQGSERGRLMVLPAAVDFRAPAALCMSVDGQPYDQVPTERPGVTPAWKVEEKVYFGTERGQTRIVHRGDCHASRDHARPATTDRARADLERDDTAPCPLCRPDRPLRTGA
jgi:hypothetical protein